MSLIMSGSYRRLITPVWIALGLLATSLLLRLLLPFIAGERAGLMEDDSYFYAQIAYNSQHFGFFTFDGISPTSGFHPLWGIILSAVAQTIGVFSQNKALHLTVYLALWFGLLLLLSLKVGRTTPQRVCFFFLGMLTAPLMETALLCVLLTVGVEQIVESTREKRNDFVLVLVGLLIPFTRIDATPVALLWLVPLWSRPRQSAILALAVLTGVFLHFAFLQLYFGHPFSVSSALKATSSLESLELFKSLSKTGILVRTAVFLGLIAWGGTGLYFQEPQLRRSSLFLFGPPILFSLGHAAVSDMRSWYFLPGYTFAFWAGTRATKLVAAPHRLTATLTLRYMWHVVVAAVLALNLYKLYRFVPLEHVRRASWAFVENATRELTTSSRVYQIDGSGFTGYWLHRHLINGDGLVNTFDYARRMRAGTLAGYFEEVGICYVITDAPLLRREKFIVNKGGLRIKFSDVDELLRSEAYGWSGNRNAHFILWKLSAERCNSHPRAAART